MKDSDFLARHWKRITVAIVAAIAATLLLIAWLLPESQLTLIVVSISTAAIGFLSWFAKSLMEHLLSKDIENHKLRLQAQNETELEKLRAELSRQALEHGVKFRRLDAKFDEHLVEVCKRLFRFYDRVSDYIGDFGRDDQPFSQEKLKAASAARE